MFEISDLKAKKLPELQGIAKDLNVPKYKTMKKLDLVYQILDVQASNPKVVKEAASETEEKSREKTKRARVIPPGINNITTAGKNNNPAAGMTLRNKSRNSQRNSPGNSKGNRNPGNKPSREILPAHPNKNTPGTKALKRYRAKGVRSTIATARKRRAAITTKT